MNLVKGSVGNLKLFSSWLYSEHPQDSTQCFFGALGGGGSNGKEPPVPMAEPIS